MPALERPEAILRARLIDVRSYTVDLDLTSGDELFGCETVIRFDCTEPGATSFVDLEPAILHRAELNGRPLELAGFDGNRLPLPGLLAENELRIAADLRYSHTAEGLHRYTDPADGAVYVYAACGPDLAPKVFPCFDQPDLKAPIRLLVTAPEEWTVVGNAALAEAAVKAGGEPAVGPVVGPGRRWEFVPTEPISTYLFTVVGGPLHSVRAEHDGIPLALHARRSLAAELEREAGELFEVTRAALDRLHRLFDQRYPFGEYQQAFVPEFNWAAMENPGCVLFQDAMLFRSEPTEAEREFRAMVVCHEMAHMWFGDLVTMVWWDDLWLNESFAEMLGYRIAADATRFTDAWIAFSARRKGWGYDADQRTSTHPVAGNGTRSVAEAVVNFDGISYAKGASVLRQLVAWLGDEAFFAGVNAYFARHAYGNAELADFLDALSQASGRDVHGWAAAWLRTSGVDTLRLDVEHDGERIVSAELVNDGTRPHGIRVGAYQPEGGALRRRASVAVEVAPGGRTRVPQLEGCPRTSLLVPNDGDLSWAKIRLGDGCWDVVASSLSRIEDPLTRALLWEHARDLVRDAELPPQAYLDLVARQLPAETVVATVEAVLRIVRTEIVGRYLAPADRPAALAVVGGAARELLDRPDAGPSLRLAALRGVVDNAVGPDPLADLSGWLDGRPRPAGLPFSPELRWSALTRLAAEGAADESLIAAELARDPSTTAVEGAARTRAALPGPEAKERAWRGLLGAGDLSNHLLAAGAAGFWQSGAPQLQEHYVRRYFTELPGAAERGDMVAKVLAGQFFPRGHATGETVRLTERLLGREDLTPTIRRVLGDELDDLRRASRARERAEAMG